MCLVVVTFANSTHCQVTPHSENRILAYWSVLVWPPVHRTLWQRVLICSRDSAGANLNKRLELNYSELCRCWYIDTPTWVSSTCLSSCDSVCVTNDSPRFQQEIPTRKKKQLIVPPFSAMSAALRFAVACLNVSSGSTFVHLADPGPLLVHGVLLVWLVRGVAGNVLRKGSKQVGS
jgi:hypothetical protein